MLWPLILPVQLTFVLLAVIFFAAVYVGQLRKWRQGRLVAGLFIGMPLMFIPSCLVVTTSVNHFRFGMFWYPDFASIQDFRIERYMPPAAADIHVYKHYSGNGYRASFRIAKADLDAWHNMCWQSHGQDSVNERPEVDIAKSADVEDFNHCFAEFKWSQPKDLTVYQGPVAGNGASYTIWYSPSDQMAFLTSCYW